jgi:hypothetical protein
MAILLAGYAVDPGDASDNYRQGLDANGSDAQQVECLVSHYPATALIRDRLLGWLPSFVSDMRPETDAIADALLAPSPEAAASWLGLEDLDRLRAEFDQQRFQPAARRLDVRLHALAFLVEKGWQDVAA